MSKLPHKSLRKEVIATCLALKKTGLARSGWGSASVRIADGFLITAAGVAFDKMKARHVVTVAMGGVAAGAFPPAENWRLHQAIYQARPEAGAVLLAASPFAAALAALGKEVPAFHPLMAATGGASLRVADYADVESDVLSDGLLKALEGRSAALLGNMGLISCAPGLSHALRLAGDVEALCHAYWAASLIGKPKVLGEAEMALVLSRAQRPVAAPSVPRSVIGARRDGDVMTLPVRRAGAKPQAAPG